MTFVSSIIATMLLLRLSFVFGLTFGYLHSSTDGFSEEHRNFLPAFGRLQQEGRLAKRSLPHGQQTPSSIFLSESVGKLVSDDQSQGKLFSDIFTLVDDVDWASIQLVVPEDGTGINRTLSNGTGTPCSDNGIFTGSECACYADYTGDQCIRRRPFTCEITLVSPNLTCSSPDAPIRVLQNLYNDPSCLKFTQHDIVELEYRLNCRFTETPTNWLTGPDYFLDRQDVPVRCTDKHLIKAGDAPRSARYATIQDF